MYLILIIVSVLWSLPISDAKVTPEFKQEEENTLSQLEREMCKQNIYDVWERSEKSYNNSKFGFFEVNLKNTYRETGILNQGEIRILICYCYNSPFYNGLNIDLRKNGGKSYPVATKVLQGAITKLMKHQAEGLPRILYRAEPNSLFEDYQNLLKSSKSGVLTQFTSTSKNLETARLFRAANHANLMITKFEDPQLGASVVDFSLYNESEVLLPVSAVYKVKTATKDGNNKYNVVLTGPNRIRTRRSVQSSANIKHSGDENNDSNFVCHKTSTSGNIKHNSNVFIIFVSVLIINLV